jgi:hypothetical protein
MVLEKRNDSISKMIEQLTVFGLYGEYLIKDTDIESFFNVYEDIVSKMKLTIKHKSATQDDAQHFSIYGNRLTSIFLSRVPITNLMRAGMQQGIELNISRYDKDLVINLGVLPYDEIMDEEEGFLITQGMLEHIADNKFNREIYDYILEDFKVNGLELDPIIPEEYRRLTESSPYIYYPKSNLYEYKKDCVCPECKYNFTANLMLESKIQSECSTNSQIGLIWVLESLYILQNYLFYGKPRGHKKIL